MGGPGLKTSVQEDHPPFFFACDIWWQSQVVSDPFKLNGGLDGLVLGGLRVFGVLLPPRSVWANGEKVMDFTYCSDSKVIDLINSPFYMQRHIGFTYSQRTTTKLSRKTRKNSQENPIYIYIFLL